MLSRFTQFHDSMRNTKWRFFEASFDISEQVSVIGMMQQADFPGGWIAQPVGRYKIYSIFNCYSITVVTIDLLCNSKALSAEYFNQNKWSKWEKKSWNDLTATPSIIVTDVIHQVMHAVFVN